MCKEKENAIFFIEQLLQEPEDKKYYPFTYQDKEHLTVAEVMFSAIIDVFKKYLEGEYRIRRTEVYLPVKYNYCLVERIQSSLELTELNTIKCIQFEYDYRKERLDSTIKMRESDQQVVRSKPKRWNSDVFAISTTSHYLSSLKDHIN